MSMQRFAQTIARVLMLPMLAGFCGACRPPPPQFAAPPPPAVTVALPVEHVVPERLELSGRTRAVEVVDVRARVKGFLETKRVDGGQRVNAGDVLFNIDPRTFAAAVREAAAQVQSTEAMLRAATLTRERILRAAQSEAATQEELDRSAAELDAANAAVEIARARLATAELELEFTTVRAPIAGRTSFVNVEEGELVGANEPTLLTRIVNDVEMYAEFEIDERTLLTLRRAHGYQRPNEGGREPLPIWLSVEGLERTFEGRFHMADAQLNVETGTLRVQAIFDNSMGMLLPGMFVRILIVLDERPAMLVPDVAVLADQAGRYVLTVNEKNVVERRAVTVGRVHERLRVIVSGLGQSERVIVNGIQRARPGAAVAPTLGVIAPPAQPSSTHPTSAQPPRAAAAP